jgi:23S rRNA pseudouridine1911/1915/1917 synthase
MNIEKREYKVSKDDQGKRLDLYIANLNNDLTRTLIKKVIEKNQVLVNDIVEFKANYRVKEGDSIVFTPLEEEASTIEPQNIPLDIIYEDNDLVVINKPTGMVVHPASGNFRNTLVNGLLYRYKSIFGVGEVFRAGLIHRLDKATSGVILVAKTNKGLWHYSKVFAERHVKKTYLVVVTGKLPSKLKNEKLIQIQSHLGRNPHNRQKFTNLDRGGKFAHSVVMYLSSNDNLHLLAVEIKTGRTHQIRVHLSSLGIPVLGDDRYGKNKYSRLMLHSWRIILPHLEDMNETEFRAPIPQSFYDIFPNLDDNINKSKI